MFHAASCLRLDLVTLNWRGKIGEPRHWAPTQRELFDYAEDKYRICPACEGIRRSPRRR